jgi:hypothetical protein
MDSAVYGTLAIARPIFILSSYAYLMSIVAATSSIYREFVSAIALAIFLFDVMRNNWLLT